MEDEKEDLEIVTNYSPIVQFGIWFFSSKKFPQYNSKGEYVNLQTRPAKDKTAASIEKFWCHPGKSSSYTA
uniref:Uncharacterized protein n=1 Tax=Solanum lycopersicum TaxID=4081 RepID=A0A3Q7H794_SOLLC